MTNRYRSAAVFFGVTLVAAMAVGGLAQAEEPRRVPVGGGTGLALQWGVPVGSVSLVHFCTLTAIGSDAEGNLVGLTNAHCAYDSARQGAGDAVFLQSAVEYGPEHDPALGRIGTVDYISGGNPIAPGPHGVGLDYAVIVFDRSKVNPVATVGDTTIRSISPPPVEGTPVCKQGKTSGRTCGNTLTSMGPYLVTTVPEFPGDSGAPVVAGEALIGNQWVWGGSSAMTAILEDLDRRGGVGAGFHLDFAG
ncbi:peptidase S1 [Nocardia seriolae]|uniref:peptidase S1 n=1 Tax=Nocardia seriolae TaxID=37332 RepID=UPI0004B5D2B6|nr:peptidase S1 [Nocardia seriolae]MTJ60634.1 peptidase S1 [Nocardia seriolae]MTJ73344.1 peptidase S1 [Nocardia seriolae]MTJ84493.1 peptidase S1 [Nocardia seriolae]MTK28480.1 peptidase S1 [Nocardia seriolae]MTK38622.1 peptidase S1 [Nocardia seriolae]